MNSKRGSKAYQPAAKRSRIKPSGRVPRPLEGVIPQLRWYVWKYERPKWDHQNGIWKKGSRLARSPRTLGIIYWSEENWERNLGLWGKFEEAHAAFCENRDLQGIGLLIEPGRAIMIGGEKVYPVFFDLDNCRDPETGQIEPWAEEILWSLDTYAEVSPSGEGIRAIGLVREPEERGCFFYTPDGQHFVTKKEDGYRRLEVYGGNRGGRHLITFTGAVLEDKPLREVKGFMDERIPKKPPRDDKEAAIPEPLGVSEEQILEIMRSSKKDGELIQQFMVGDKGLWKGENAIYKRRSYADLAFFRKLAFYARGDKGRVLRIALSSGMRREKRWSPDYLNNNIEKAISSCKGNFYDPAYSSTQEDDREVPRAKVYLSDNDLLRKLAETKGERFEKLWEGDEGLWTDSGPYEKPEKDSEKGLEAAQLGLCSMLSFVTGNDEARVDRLFRRSGLYKDNWKDETYRTRTLKMALSETIFDPDWRPDNGERDSALDVLEEIRLGLVWDVSGGINACYDYLALIGKGRIDGRLKKDIGPEYGIDKKVLREIDQHDGEPEVVVEAAVRGLMQGSGVYSKGGTNKRRKILEEAGLIKTLKEGRKREPSVYLLRSPKHIPRKIIPYPTGFVGTLSGCQAFQRGLDDLDIFGIDFWRHPLQTLSFRRTMKSVPKTPFRSPLNSMACHDKNIKDLLLRTRVEEDHPDKDEHRGFEGEFLLHPPLALSAPYNAPVYRFQQPSPDRPMDAATRLNLVRTQGLSPKQKFVLEQIDYGRRSLLELEKFFDVVTDKEKSNFRRRYLRPLEKESLIVSFQDERYGKSYEKAENFEQALEEVFTRSGSAEKYEEIRGRAGRERKADRVNLEEWEKNRRKAEEKLQRGKELLELYTNKGKSNTSKGRVVRG
ncbi:hypothetical protein GBA63_09190 [Rubrobacter tropicus]|uniref:NrS-1 polymerase-like HBD domain-containing protein n=1 Tax=Rubrobacter tropicus TaxID=2653851 RepID=A0A6G8Q8K6_9ACTN|nr:hypothetical protein [Rubrobacter tropicus]QIN82806.1 hypothetical protein GBA63_09190 [Rubrobacter tropicus]